MLSDRRGSRVPGHTLIELLVSLTLLSAIVGALVAILVRQGRLHSAAAHVIDTRGRVREAVEVLSAELRGLAPSQGDIYAMSTSSIEYRGAIGASVACEIDPADRRVVILPPASGRGDALSAWQPEPEAGDSALVYDPGPSAGVGDDAWRVYAVAAAPRAGVCPAASGFTASAAEAARGRTVRLDRALDASIPTGSAMRFFRRTRYALYLSADGLWYLGSLDCRATRTPACASIQPVTGPFESARPVATSGLALTYWDSTGAPTSDPRAVARIDIVVRARSRDPMRANGVTWSVFHDSAAVSIGVRG